MTNPTRAQLLELVSGLEAELGTVRFDLENGDLGEAALAATATHHALQNLRLKIAGLAIAQAQGDVCECVCHDVLDEPCDGCHTENEAGR